MTEDVAADVAPAAVAEVAPAQSEAPVRRPFGRLARLAGVLRPEDWLLAGTVGLVSPALLAAQGGGGPFDPGRPLDGLLRVAGVLGALACLATRTQGATTRSAVDGASIGPLTGGLLLVGGSAAASFGLDPAVAFGPTLVLVLVFSLLGNLRPALPIGFRRALVTPFVLAAGSLFWNVVRSVAGSGSFSGQIGTAFASDPQASLLVVGLVAAGAGVYYAMLVYAPRQVAEREGGPLEWLVRFGLFFGGVVFGLGWLAALGG